MKGEISGEGEALKGVLKILSMWLYFGRIGTFPATSGLWKKLKIRVLK
jgi:hypothetical protein